MPKPSALYTWATAANFAAGPAAGTPTKVAPSAGQQTEGYEPSERPGAQNWNALLGNLFEWAAYVNARWNSSDQLIGPLTVAGTLTTTGAYLHTCVETMQVHAASALPAAAADWLFSGGAWTHQSNNSNLIVPLDVVVCGQRLVGITVHLRKNTTNTTTLTMELVRVSATDPTSATVIASTTHAGAADGNVEKFFTCSETTDVGFVYEVRVRRSAGAGTGDSFHNVQVDYDRPTV